MELGKLIGTIKKLNDNKSLQDWAKNTHPDTGAKVMVDKIKQKAYNETLYDFVETRTGAEYQDARKLMHDHMAIEKQVADKAVTFMRRAPKGFFDVVDPHLALEFARGLWKLDPSAIVGSGAGWFVKRQWKKMNSPDHNIKQLFKTTDKYLPERGPFDASKLPTQTPEPEQIIDLTDRIPTYEETVPTVGAQPTPPVGVPAAGTQPGISGPGEPAWNRPQFKIVERPQPVGARVRGAVESPTPIGPPQGVPASEPTGMPPQAYGPRIDRSVVEELPKNIVLKSARPDFGVKQERSLPYVEGGREVPASAQERLPKEAYEASREREILESLPKWKIVIKSGRPDYSGRQERSLPYVSGATEVPSSGPTGLPTSPKTVAGSSANEAVMDFLATKLGYAKVKSIGNLIEQASAARRPSQRAMDVVDLLNQMSETTASGQEMSTARHLVDQLREKISQSQRGKK